MSHIVSMDSDGHLVYEGLLSTKEIATVSEILNTLKEEIPQVESDLTEKYGKSVLYKYYLGSFLSQLLEKYNILGDERKKFWDEIKTFATTETRTRKESKKAETRSFFAQCYRLSQLDIKVVEKLSWRQWQDLLDRVDNREDERIFIWIGNYSEKIREDDWREFEKALHQLLKKKDTSVFTDDEVFRLYDSLMSMVQYWRVSLSKFAKENPKSAKIKSKGRRSKKYQAECYRLKKEKRIALNDEVFREAFASAMK